MVFNNMLMWGVSGITDEVVVTIEGRNVVKEYNGSSQSISNYVIKSISNTEYTAADFIFSGSASASGTDVGTYLMNLSASQFTNINGKFKNVRFVVTDGYIRINPKNVTVAAVAKSKTYDGKTSTDPALTATVTGLLGSDTVTYTLSRVSGQNAGEYTISPTGESTQGNYLVNYSTAKFTINPASCTLTADSGTRIYNGSVQSITTFTSNPSGLTFASSVKASGSGTNAGAYTVSFSGITLNSTEDTTGNYKVTGVTSGTLTINPAEMAITVNGNITTRTYNGSSQSVTGTVTATSTTSGFSASKFSYSGTKTVVGTNVGSYSTALVRGSCSYSDTNYTVTWTIGTAIRLTINKASLGLSVSGYSGTYDGSAHTITATCSVTSGTTIQYSTDNTNWSTITPTRTNAGTTTVYVKATNTDTTNYSTASASASIVISKRTVTVTIIGASDETHSYDGLTYTITGYTPSSSWSGYTEGSSGYTVGGTITVSGRVTGTYSQDITVTNNNPDNITLNTSIKNGTLTITERGGPTPTPTSSQLVLYWTASANKMVVVDGEAYTSGLVRLNVSAGSYTVTGVNMYIVSVDTTNYQGLYIRSETITFNSSTGETHTVTFGD